MAISVDHQYEGSICTGSLIRNGEKTYAFYAVRMCDGTPAQITYSVSEDGIHYEKSYRCLTLSKRFDAPSARDPKVIQDEDGLFHMFIITTSLECLEGKPGCLAHLISSNLEDWEELEDPIYISPTRSQPECPDYIKYGDWYYLIYSLDGNAQYRFSKHPFRDWIQPENNIIGTLSFKVPKLAEFNGNRLIAAGYMPLFSPEYGGVLRLLEVLQNPDGTLKFQVVEELGG